MLGIFLIMTLIFQKMFFDILTFAFHKMGNQRQYVIKPG